MGALPRRRDMHQKGAQSMGERSSRATGLLCCTALEPESGVADACHSASDIVARSAGTRATSGPARRPCTLTDTVLAALPTVGSIQTQYDAIRGASVCRALLRQGVPARRLAGAQGSMQGMAREEPRREELSQIIRRGWRVAGGDGSRRVKRVTTRVSH